MRQLHQQLLAVVEIERISELLGWRIWVPACIEYLSPAYIRHIQIRQRRKLVAVADLEGEVAQCETFDRSAVANRGTVGSQDPSALGFRIQTKCFQAHPQLMKKLRLSLAAYSGCKYVVHAPLPMPCSPSAL